MTLTLILTRHAKSAWDDPTQDDFDRTLNGRGRRSAVALGQWLAEAGHLPDDVVVSAAARTVETWSRMAPHLPSTATMKSNPALYLASPDTMLNVIKSESARTLMLIGHNLGIAELASRLVKSPPGDRRFRDYPTGATTVMHFEAEGWNDVGPGQGVVSDFVVPRDLL